LDPRDTYSVSDPARGDTGTHGDDLPDRLVSQDAGEIARELAPGLVDVGVTDAAGADLDQDLIWTGFRFRDLPEFPCAMNRGDHCGSHVSIPFYRRDAGPKLRD
jgi:hypothetical protein